MKKIHTLVRILYGIIGIVGLMSTAWMIFGFNSFINMGIWIIGVNVLGNIAMLNWGVVAITGSRKKDLFGLLGL